MGWVSGKIAACCQCGTPDPPVTYETWDDIDKVVVGGQQCPWPCGTQFLFTRKATKSELAIVAGHHHMAMPGQNQHPSLSRSVTMVDLLPAKTLLYIADLKPRQEKQKEETKKIIVIVFQLQPFNFEMADEMGVAPRLFGTDKKPLEDVLSATIGLKDVPLYNMAWRMAPDSDATLFLPDVKVTPSIAVRRDKEGPVYSATFSVSVLYPSADDLLKLLHSYTESRYVTFEASTAKLPLETAVDGEVVDEGIKPGEDLGHGRTAQ